MAATRGKHLFFSFILFAALLSACTQPAPETAAPTEESAPEVTEAPADTPEPTPEPKTGELLVETSYGPIEGFSEDGVRKFYGIPFAAPPVDDLRWRVPEPPASWEDIRPADTFSMPCAGIYDLEAGTNLREVSEDCLYLNVWAPAEPEELLPVMVWIHGGAFTSGAGSNPLYYGTNFAKKGVVYVNLNYRLGPFGFLAHPDFIEENELGITGNYAILDMIAALEWVRDNAEAFGGDPDNVTIFGESSGATGVHALTRSPLAEGLFQRAIRQSGGMGDTNKEEIMAAAVNFQSALRAESVEELRAMPTAQILKVISYGMGFQGSLPIDPISDGIVILPIQESGELMAQFEHIVGINRDETSFFWDGPRYINPSQYDAYLVENMGAQADTIKAVLPGETAEEAFKALIQVDSMLTYGKSTFVDLNLLADAGATVYAYQFNRVAPVYTSPWIGAAHAVEIRYIFSWVNVNSEFTEEDEALSRLMADTWIQFARHGDPNATGLAEWEPFTAENQAYLAWDAETEMVAYAEDLLLSIILGLGTE